MPRNIAKPFSATLSIIDINPISPRYKTFFDEDVEVTIDIVDELKKPLDLTDTVITVYYVCPPNGNLVQTDGITMLNEIGRASCRERV